jgi:hypothetical protein
MSGSHVSAGWTGRIVLDVRLVTRGELMPVLELIPLSTGDHRGHNVLYGGIAAQYWALIDGETMKMETIRTMGTMIAHLDILSVPNICGSLPS